MGDRKALSTHVPLTSTIFLKEAQEQEVDEEVIQLPGLEEDFS